MKNKYLSLLKNSVKNIPGWRTKRKILVIESDDWGSIRMPSREVYNNCLKNGYRVDKNIFSRYDSLASEEDLTLLFDLLSSYHDKNGQHPIITANCLTCNPDFEKIHAVGYSEYHSETIDQTFKKYPKHSNCLQLWKEAKEKSIFFPQFHGREHLNVSRFMTDLQNNNEAAKFAFDNRMPGIFEKSNVEHGNNYVVSLEFYDERDKIEKEEIISDGLKIFESLFNYRSTSFIATNYVWHEELNKILSENNVEFIQGSQFQLIPKGNFGGFERKFHYIGQQNRFKQIYLVRNAYFEPSLRKNYDWISSVLREIDNAFFWNKPAIISSHRLNYVGFIDEKNRDENLKLLKLLISSILKLHPDVEFMTSVQLGKEIKNSLT
jgi:hypothetical protein